MIPGDWTLRTVSDSMKKAAVSLAELDGKDPFAMMRDGSREIWCAYIPEVERVLIIVDALLETMSGHPRPKMTLDESHPNQ